MDYIDFIRAKSPIPTERGIIDGEIKLNPMLKPHQRDIATWAIRGGRRAIFAAFGLGKTFIQLEIMRVIHEHEGGRQLIVAPLGVRQEFRLDAAKLGIGLTFVRRSEEVGGPGIYITNYESVRDGRLDVNLFNAASLDEASVLRSFGSLTYQSFLGLFHAIKYRFVATATPSPNRYKELLHYAGFLGIMDTGQSLTRFFKRDSTKANNLKINPHKEREFWLWVASWAMFLQRPSDLGYSNEGYDLPPLQVHKHMVVSESEGQVDRWGQASLFRDASLSMVDAAREKRATLDQRIEKMIEIVKTDPGSHYILWHDQESERHAIKKALPEAVEVYGSQDLDVREERIMRFSDGEFKYLATKPILSGSGCNFQRHCHKAIFLGIGFKFNDFIQAVHRIHRFLQGFPCEIHLIYADSEAHIMSVLEEKWKRHIEMVDKMTEIIRKYGLSHQEMANEIGRAIGIERIEASGDGWKAVNNDCVQETATMPENSVDLIVTSIPFANHYEYTPSYNDFGHTDNNDHFWKQMDFLTPNLYRILRPGRIYACHVKDRILFGNVTGKGFPTVSPFHMEATFHAMKHGFNYAGMVTVVTDVVRENNQTYRLGWTEQCKDGSKMGVGSPEYILLLRKPQTDLSKGYADTPVKKDKTRYSRARWQVDAHDFWRSSGDRLLDPDFLAGLPMEQFLAFFREYQVEKVYDYDTHVKIGEAMELCGKLPATFMAIAPESKHPDVWTDIVRMRTLNSEQCKRNQEQHICPLQLDIVERLIERYSMAGETIFDPFGGIMTVPYVALKMGRKGIASELNAQYWADGVKYLEMAERDKNAKTLFDVMEVNA